MNSKTARERGVRVEIPPTEANQPQVRAQQVASHTEFQAVGQSMLPLACCAKTRHVMHDYG
jgi:hypothetical protein